MFNLDINEIMRKVVFIVMMLSCAAVWAQAPATAADGRQDSVKAATVQEKSHVSDTSIIREDGWHGDYYLYNSYHERQNLHSFDDFCTTFTELNLMWGWRQTGIGVNFAMVPGRFGGYAEGVCGDGFNALSFGPVMRLFDDHHIVDWQVYGGLMLGYSAGFEVGTRLASGRGLLSGAFSWWSISSSTIWMGGEQYYTFGLSLGLATVGLLSLWW